MAADASTFYVKLRKTVATDAKAARRDFCALLSEPPELLDAVLSLATQAGEGRVRQMIATAARLERFVERIESWLRKWHPVESNEFARSAIQAALASIAPEDTKPAADVIDDLPFAFVDTYRFVADRICHRVSNTLTVPSAMLVRLEQLQQTVKDEDARVELSDILSRLRPALHRLSQALEFDTGDDYLQWQMIPLGEWLDAAKAGFVARCGHAKLTIIGTARARGVRIRATQYLLDTAFGNLWMNAVQATEQKANAECHITAEFNLTDTSLDVLLRDNGSGFSAAMVESAFRVQYSTKGEARGRGLLEVADAIRRLQGRVKLLPVAPNEYRVHFSFNWTPS